MPVGERLQEVLSHMTMFRQPLKNYGVFGGYFLFLLFFFNILSLCILNLKLKNYNASGTTREKCVVFRIANSKSSFRRNTRYVPFLPGFYRFSYLEQNYSVLKLSRQLPVAYFGKDVCSKDWF